MVTDRARDSENIRLEREFLQHLSMEHSYSMKINKIPQGKKTVNRKLKTKKESIHIEIFKKTKEFTVENKRQQRHFISFAEQRI